AQLDHVVILDDGSPDATAAKAREAGAEVIVHEVNRGKGAAIKTGLKALTDRGFQYIQILDGDGQHLPEEIPRFLDEANHSQSHIILGNRMSDVEEMPFVRKMTNRFMSWQISHVCRQIIPDSQCGFRMIHRDLAPSLFCETDAFDYETEMLLIAARAGFKISAVPVSTVYGEEKSKIRPIRDTIRFYKLMARYHNSREAL
ncbi:MAG: glycosyltransferase family 2 protein, partial [Chthoniobacteraceae bacterium]